MKHNKKCFVFFTGNKKHSRYSLMSHFIFLFLISPFAWVYINHVMTACHFRECKVGQAPTLYLLSFWFSSSIRSWYFAISDWMELRNVLLWSVSIGSSWKQKEMKKMHLNRLYPGQFRWQECWWCDFFFWCLQEGLESNSKTIIMTKYKCEK